MRIASVGGLVACLAVAAGVLWGGGSAQASLQKALENQAKAKSMRMVATTTYDPPLPEAARKLVPAETKHFHQGGKMRLEQGDRVTVSDGKRMVTLDTKAKVAKVIDLGPAVARLDKAALMPATQKLSDAFQGKGDATPVAAVEIGGKARPGFKMAGPSAAPGQTSEVTYWLDADKNLPLRSVMTMRMKELTATTTTDYLGYDEELDEKLFDTTIPEGYTVGELPLPKVEVAPPKVVKPRLIDIEKFKKLTPEQQQLPLDKLLDLLDTMPAAPAAPEKK